jgi:hypothetical protein
MRRSLANSTPDAEDHIFGSRRNTGPTSNALRTLYGGEEAVEAPVMVRKKDPTKMPRLGSPRKVLFGPSPRRQRRGSTSGVVTKNVALRKSLETLADGVDLRSGNFTASRASPSPQLDHSSGRESTTTTRIVPVTSSWDAPSENRRSRNIGRSPSPPGSPTTFSRFSSQSPPVGRKATSRPTSPPLSPTVKRKHKGTAGGGTGSSKGKVSRDASPSKSETKSGARRGALNRLSAIARTVSLKDEPHIDANPVMAFYAATNSIGDPLDRSDRDWFVNNEVPETWGKNNPKKELRRLVDRCSKFLAAKEVLIEQFRDFEKVPNLNAIIIAEMGQGDKFVNSMFELLADAVGSSLSSYEGELKEALAILALALKE